MFKRAIPLLGAAALLAACASGTSSPSTSAQAQTPTAAPSSPAASTSSGTQVAVTLQEWSIVLDKTSVPAGEVTFHVTNTGPKEVHEFVIIKTDLAPGDLPQASDGTAIEESKGLEAVDEVEDVAIGSSSDLTVTLKPGKYVLICNIVDDGQAHYMLGMRASITAE
jgi:uncharacterized cupredoxin-like copper-binding protein